MNSKATCVCVFTIHEHQHTGEGTGTIQEGDLKMLQPRNITIHAGLNLKRNKLELVPFENHSYCVRMYYFNLDDAVDNVW